MAFTRKDILDEQLFMWHNRTFRLKDAHPDGKVIQIRNRKNRWITVGVTKLVTDEYITVDLNFYAGKLKGIVIWYNTMEQLTQPLKK